MDENKEKSFKCNNSLQLSAKSLENDSESGSSCHSSEDEKISKFDKYIYTFLLCYANLTYGISLTCMSPALLDFTCVLDTDPEIVTHYYTLYAVGTMIGSLFGFLFKYINRQFTLIMTLFLFGVVTSALPYTPDFPLFYLFGFIGGMGAGSLDIVQTVWLMEMWDSKSGSVLQLSEFAYGVGMTVGPFIVAPFISGEENCLNTTLSINETRIDYSAKLLPPFLATGCLLTLGAVLLALMYFFHKYIPKNSDEKEIIENEIKDVLRPIENLYHRRYTVQIIDNTSPDSSRVNSVRRKQALGPRYSIQVTGFKSQGEKTHRELTRFHTVPLKRRYSSFHLVNLKPEPTPPELPIKTIMGLGVICFATILVTEAAYMDYSPTFFHMYAGVKASTAANMLSVMFATYTLTRAASIFIAIRAKPDDILFIHYMLVFISLVTLFYANEYPEAMWFGNVLFGIGIAVFWSATFSYFENYFEITDRIGTIYVATLGFLEMGTQFIEGPFLEEKPEMLLYYCSTASLISFIAFFIIKIIVYRFNVTTNANNDKSIANTVNNNNNNTNNKNVFNEQNVTKI